ncbi:hypothetical protein TrVE_jg7918 [Triparma verrucosa]|uniref:Uncharacterized protein n=1 Tax=Triparma verrucosa TaxID=1606542 RepID=A0A9W7BWA1_9STRA|nr:hypothetical protein TrVE_jg7918 [Triparma verrucosa]
MAKSAEVEQTTAKSSTGRRKITLTAKKAALLAADARLPPKITKPNTRKVCPPPVICVGIPKKVDRQYQGTALTEAFVNGMKKKFDAAGMILDDKKLGKHFQMVKPTDAEKKKIRNGKGRLTEQQKNMGRPGVLCNLCGHFWQHSNKYYQFLNHTLTNHSSELKWEKGGKKYGVVERHFTKFAFDSIKGGQFCCGACASTGYAVPQHAHQNALKQKHLPEPHIPTVLKVKIPSLYLFAMAKLDQESKGWKREEKAKLKEAKKKSILNKYCDRFLRADDEESSEEVVKTVKAKSKPSVKAKAKPFVKHNPNIYAKVFNSSKNRDTLINNLPHATKPTLITKQK